MRVELIGLAENLGMEYILFVHNNVDTKTNQEDWSRFFELAMKSGLFQGGSEIGERILLGAKAVADTTNSIVGYMRFESESAEPIIELLKEHPVLKCGGSLELCELPKS